MFLELLFIASIAQDFFPGFQPIPAPDPKVVMRPLEKYDKRVVPYNGDGDDDAGIVRT